MLLGINRCVSGDNATLSEFEEVLKAMNRPSLVPLAPRIFDLFDNNRDGTVDMREILCGFSSFKNSKGDDALRLCFQVCLFTNRIYSQHKHKHISILYQSRMYIFFSDFIVQVINFLN